MGTNLFLCLTFVLCGVLCASSTPGEANGLLTAYSALSLREINAVEEFEPNFRNLKIWNNIKNKILSAWNNLVESAKNTNSKINDWFKDVKERADQIAAGVKISIKEKELELKQKLQKMADKAKEIGVDVNECMVEQEDDIREVVMTSIAQLGNCLSKKIVEVEGIGNSIKNIIEHAIDLSDIIRNRLNECKEESRSVPKCLSSVAGQIVNEAAKISKEVLQTALSVKDIIGKLETALPACAAENALEIATRFAKLATGVGICVKEKMDAAKQIDHKLIYLLN